MSCVAVPVTLTSNEHSGVCVCVFGAHSTCTWWDVRLLTARLCSVSSCASRLLKLSTKVVSLWYLDSLTPRTSRWFILTLRLIPSWLRLPRSSRGQRIPEDSLPNHQVCSWKLQLQLHRQFWIRTQQALGGGFARCENGYKHDNFQGYIRADQVFNFDYFNF